jgi:hypothetical protein
LFVVPFRALAIPVFCLDAIAIAIFAITTTIIGGNIQRNIQT